MRARAVLIFWAATLSSALLLGAIWSLKNPFSGSGWTTAFLLIAVAGFAITFSIAARIAFVVGRAKSSGISRTTTAP